MAQLNDEQYQVYMEQATNQARDVCIQFNAGILTLRELCNAIGNIKQNMPEIRIGIIDPNTGLRY